jgi:protease-4
MLETNPAADFPTSIRPLSDEERETFRGLIEHTYLSFLGRVAEGRGMSVEEADAVAQGRVWSGAAAAERGLVDEVGGLAVALEEAKVAAGLEPGAPVDLHVYPREETLLDRLRDALYLRQLGGSRVGIDATSARQRAIAAVLGEMTEGLSGFGVALRQGPGRAIAALPWVPAVR